MQFVAGELKRGLSLISSSELRGAAVVALGFRRLSEPLGEAREIQVRAASLLERQARLEEAARLAPQLGVRAQAPQNRQERRVALVLGQPPLAPLCARAGSGGA